MTRGGAFREHLAKPSVGHFSFWGPFFLCVLLHPFFHNKITFVSKLVPKMVPKSLPNLTLDPFFLIFWKPCFGTTLHCFYYILGFLPAPKGTRNTTKTMPGKDNNKNTWISCKKQESFRKGLPNGVQKGDWISGDSTLAPLVAPLAPQSVFFLKKIQPKLPKVTPRLQK